MIYLIFYDIEDDKLRKKISDKLLSFGMYRLQYSVFAGFQQSEHIYKIYTKLEELMKKSDNNTDKIYSLKISRDAFNNMYSIGNISFDKKEITGEKSTMIF